MIRTQELKIQIEELTKQNETIMSELDQVKKMMEDSQSILENSSTSDSQDSKDNQNNQNNQNNQKNQDNQKKMSELATDLLKIKDLAAQLETKTAQYVTNVSANTLNEKDVVNLVLTLINGMVDWASDFVTEKSQSSGQLQ